ncbi:MAG: hypothetical protein QXJ17_07965 [Nitrososphaeria archaeon]
MPSAALPHVLGTISLLLIMSSVLLMSNLILLNLNNDAIKASLKETTNYISHEVVEVVSLASSTGSSELFCYRLLDIPYHLQNYGYTIKYAKDELGWKVVAYINEYETIYAESRLNWVSGIQVINSTQVVNNIIENRPSVQSGASNIVIWCQRFTNGTVRVGMGVLL